MVADAPTRAGITFQGKDPDETFQFYFRQHWIRLLRPFLKLLLWNGFIIAAGLILFAGADIANVALRQTLLLLLLGLFLFSHLQFLSRFYRYFLYVIVITDRKVHRIKKTLLTIDEHQSIDLWVLQDMHTSQHGVLQNILGFGTISLEAQDTHLRIHFIPNIRKRYDDLTRLREQARMVSQLTPQLRSAQKPSPGSP